MIDKKIFKTRRHHFIRVSGHFPVRILVISSRFVYKIYVLCVSRYRVGPVVGLHRDPQSWLGCLLWVRGILYGDVS